MRSHGVPTEHIAILLGLTPAAVEALLAHDKFYITAAEVEEWRALQGKGCNFTEIARVSGRARDGVSLALRGKTCRFRPKTVFPIKRPRSTIRGDVARHVRTLSDLGYPAERIADLLIHPISVVTDFIARLEPLRGPRRNAGRLPEPRSPHREEQAKLSAQRADDRRRRREEERAADRERRARLLLHRSPVDAWGDRGTKTELADYARLLTAVREGGLSTDGLIGLAARLHYAAPRPRSDVPAPEPMIWTGPTNRHATGPIGPVALTAGQTLEAADLLRSGMPWTRVAERFGVSENTLRRYIRDIAPRRAASVFPTASTRYEHGVVRWDRPLGTTQDGTHRTVLVECDCGRERRVWTSEVTRPRNAFTGQCHACHHRDFLDRNFGNHYRSDSVR